MSEHQHDADGRCDSCRTYGFCEQCGCPDQGQHLPVVAAPSKMDDETFIKHFNARHSDPASYLGRIDARTSWPDQVATYRAYHLKLHDGIVPGPVIGHTHTTGDQPWQDPKGTK